MKKLLCISLISAVLLGFASCGGGKPTIAGVWRGEEDGDELVYIFREDGTGNATAGDAASDFTYALEGDCLTVTLGGNTDTATVTVTADTLTLTDEYGTTVLTRDKEG